MDYNNDFKYDLKLGQQGETIIAKLLNDATIEVKTDFIVSSTNITSKMWLVLDSESMDQILSRLQ